MTEQGKRWSCPLIVATRTPIYSRRHRLIFLTLIKTEHEKSASTQKNRDIKKEVNVPKQFSCFPILTCTHANSNFFTRFTQPYR